MLHVLDIMFNDKTRCKIKQHGHIVIKNVYTQKTHWKKETKMLIMIIYSWWDCWQF